MRTFLVLLGRELKSYFQSPIGYIVLFFFLLITGFNFSFNITLLNNQPTDVSLIEFFFNTVIFWFGYVLIFPLITMRIYSEEFKLGTIEALMTAPVTDFQVVLAKFSGAFLFYAVLWLPSLLYFRIFTVVTGEAAAPAPGVWIGSYFLLALMGMFYISVGCLASALTKNQIVAAVISFCSITLLFFSGLFSLVASNVTPFFRDLTGYFSAIEHMREFSSGIIDTRPIVFYTSMTILMLVITFHVFQARRWKV